MTRTLQFAAIILISALVLPLQAQQPTAEQKAARKELRSSMRTWFTTSVAPTLSSWKRTYDASLSAADLATLNTLRAEAARLRATMKQASKEERHAAMRSLIERVKPIAKNSKEALMSIFTNGKPQIDTWRAEARSIMERWQAAHPDASAHGGMHHMKALFGAEGDQKVKRAALRFMLWDGTIPGDEKTEAPLYDSDDDNIMSLSPAPSDHSTVVKVEGLIDGPATIDVYDMNGTLVRSIPTTVVNGAIDQRIDVSSLNAGTYMASVNTERGRRTTQLVVHR